MKTKRQIQKELKDVHGIDVTLRPRKTTLERLLKEANEVCDPRRNDGFDYDYIWIILTLSLCMIALLPWID